MNIIVTWMYSSPKSESILHSQMGKRSGTQKNQNYYWRCVFLLFESSSRLNPASRHVLFINKKPPNKIDGIDINRLIQQYNIELVEFPKITKSPPDYYGAWNTQFIVLDVLDWLTENVKASDNIFVLDSDIIFNKPINDDLLIDLRTHKALLYSIDYAINHNINGLTRLELLELSKEMDSGFSEREFVYSGGEYICCLGSEISKIACLGREVFLVCLERHQAGRAKFNEEAHLLSYVYHSLGYPTHKANKFIKRIWTNRAIFSNIDGSEHDLIFWHLPAEKRTGFVKVFRSFREKEGEYNLTINNFGQAYRIEETFLSRIVRCVELIARYIYRNLRGITRCFS
ncbi:MAG: hypothetical protein ABGZ19_10045 [Verrucomicrobiales bacterium]|nr:hypothetical protein [Nitrospinaceae bacterium]